MSWSIRVWQDRRPGGGKEEALFRSLRPDTFLARGFLCVTRGLSARFTDKITDNPLEAVVDQGHRVFTTDRRVVASDRIALRVCVCRTLRTEANDTYAVLRILQRDANVR